VNGLTILTLPTVYPTKTSCSLTEENHAPCPLLFRLKRETGCVSYPYILKLQY